MDYEIVHYSIVICILSTYLVAMLAAVSIRKNIVLKFTYTVPRRNALWITIIGYLLLRASVIVEIGQALLYGDYVTYALGKAIARYEGVSVGMWYNFGTVFFITYCGLLGSIAGRNVGSNHKKINLLYIITFIFMIIVESSSLARAGVLLGFSLFFAEYLFANRNKFAKTSYRRIVRGFVVTGLILFVVFFFSAYFRVSSSDNAFTIVTEKVYGYSTGGHEAFLTWFNLNYTTTQLDFGINTVGFVYKAFGYTMPQGHYERITAEQSNIFLIYRDLFQDFGLLIGLSVFFAISFAINYGSKFELNRPATILVKMSLVIFFFLIVSPFYFTTFGMGFVFCALLQKRGVSYKLQE
jgi:oligosaccharide repeat unit polymerase